MVSQVELNDLCYQYSEGYPNILNSVGYLGVNPDRHFQYLGCSGATVKDVIELQVPKMKRSEVVTISAGGIDADFVHLIDSCIYRYWTTADCDDELKKTKERILAPA